MPKPTKLFISSVAQDTLTGLRATAFDELATLGHFPEMFEKTFGPWPMNATGIQHCLDKVKECDVYCLFIHSKAGSMTSSGRTITHLEFLKAIEEDKVLVLFAETTIKSKYFGSIRWIIKDFVDEFIKTNAHTPNYIEICNYLEIKSEEVNSDIPSKHNIEMYVWVLLYDIVDVHGKYIEDLSYGTSVPWKSYLSDLLRQGVNLIPKSKIASESMQLANAFGDFTDFTLLVLASHLRINDFINLPRLLSRLISALRGANITKDFPPLERTIGKVKTCSAVCLFQREGNILKTVQSAGDTDGDNDFTIDDPDSFVAYTYHNVTDEEPALFYLESKRMFYFTFKIGEYVISYHFPEETQWNQQMFTDYTEDIIDGIINSHANTFIFDFMNFTIRGLQK
ncbi:DUF4062 domain-containing protein [Paenibacillus arenilitoris]|uniref:DUF4062 domain-containing protein n=1 Tax=Paenibacillus arenilitoris TaxID=2772299 RepID=A0A927CQD3_9BACL|nr:DUF4062 domain-containing protein [Paenibacillus arenilitoris]MBD2870878.1 DUF4062 domain-containing protein [Paenibacillus arenilitoris]